MIIILCTAILKNFLHPASQKTPSSETLNMLKTTKEWIPFSVFIILEDEYSLGLLNWNEKHILLELTWWFLFSLVSYKLNDADCIFMLIYFKMVPGAKKASINASLVFQIQFDVIYFKYMWTEKDNVESIFWIQNWVSSWQWFVKTQVLWNREKIKGKLNCFFFTKKSKINIFIQR